MKTYSASTKASTTHGHAQITSAERMSSPEAMLSDILAIANVVEATRYELSKVVNTLIGPEPPTDKKADITAVPLDLSTAIRILRSEVETLRVEVERLF